MIDAIDPVCGMSVSRTRAISSSWNGKMFYFCSLRCKESFDLNPEGFLTKPNGKEQMPNADKVIEYTCPMHPEIVQPTPGHCPICGMALEHRTPAADENHELSQMQKRFWISLALASPFLLAMAQHFLSMHWFSGTRWLMFQFALATPIVVWGAYPFFQRGWESLRTRNYNMFTLISIGVAAAYGYSLIAAFFPGLFPAIYRDETGHVAVYFEAASLITVLVLLGQVIELRARSKTGSAIKALLDLAPKKAWRILSDGREEEVLASEVHVNDRLRVRPGERVPADGRLLEGRGNVDESMISGEPTLVEKQAGSNLIGGSINQQGSFIMLAEQIGDHTLLAHIVRSVSEAIRSRAPIQRIADRVSNYFVPAVLVISAVTFFAWWIFGPQPKFLLGIINAIAVLLIACPCALGLATPMSIMVGIGRGAAEGVLIRDASVLEAMERVNTVIFDKTGTLTIGRPIVSTINIVSPNLMRADFISLTASLGAASEHPLSAAITRAARESGVSLKPVSHFEYFPGKGVSGIVDDHSVVLGNSRLLQDQGIGIASLNEAANTLRQNGNTVVFVAIDRKASGLIGISDPLKPTTMEAVKMLRNAGLKLIMATGDNRVTANAMAQQLKLDRVIAEILPDDKVNLIHELKHDGRVVAMAGDGINDAPALSAADVGVAMGTGTDIAIESAGVTLVKGDLRGFAKARKLSQSTMRNIRQNLVLAFLYNALSIPIAAGMLYPFFGILLSPVIASAAMALSSISVILNAVRLRRIEL